MLYYVGNVFELATCMTYGIWGRPFPGPYR